MAEEVVKYKAPCGFFASDICDCLHGNCSNSGWTSKTGQSRHLLAKFSNISCSLEEKRRLCWVTFPLNYMELGAETSSNLCRKARWGRGRGGGGLREERGEGKGIIFAVLF